MAITGQIPIGRMPIDYLNQGTGAINDILQKAREAALQHQQLQEMAKFHGADIGLRQQAGTRAAQQMDPMFQVRQIQAMVQGLQGLSQHGKQGQSNTPMGQDMPFGEGQGMPKMPPLAPDNSVNPGVTAEGPGSIMSGSPFVGRVGYKPQQQPQSQETQNPMSEEIIPGITLEDITRHALGLPARKAPVETPEQKTARELDVYRKKAEIKAAQEGQLPGAVKTLHENIIHISPKAIKAIDHIINIPSPVEPWGFGAIKSGQKAAHNKGVTAAAESYAKAQGWPNTKGSIQKAEEILQRGNFETDFDYRKRLRGYQDELRAGIKTSSELLHPTTTASNGASSDKDPLGLGI